MKTWCSYFIAGCCLGIPLGSVHSQETEPAPAARADSSDGRDRALKYYPALVKRPAAGYLFDRFFNAWLDSQTTEELEKFLISKADAPGGGPGERMLLALFFAKQGDGKKASEQFASVLAKNPDNAIAWLQKALLHVRANEYEEAVSAAKNASGPKADKDTRRQALQLQGRMLARLGRRDEAVDAWNKLLAERPDDEELQEDLVELQLSEGLNDEALATAQSLLAKTKDPYQRVQRRMRIGDIQNRKGDQTAALATYSQCLEDVGSDSWLEKEVLAQVEQIFRRQDNIAGLRQFYADLVAAHPQRLALFRAQARVLTDAARGTRRFRFGKIC